MQVLLFSAKPGRFDSDSSQASGHNISQRAIGRQRKAEEELLGRVQTRVRSRPSRESHWEQRGHGPALRPTSKLLQAQG